MDPASRRLYYNRCHPFDTLAPGDDRYVDIDAIDPEHPVRGEDWVARLARGIELSNRPVYELFTGLPGSGKSTELRRLVQRLQSKHQLLPVLIDGEDAIDLSNPIDIPDIYFAILYYTDAKVLELEGKSATAAMHEGYLRRFWTLAAASKRWQFCANASCRRSSSKAVRTSEPSLTAPSLMRSRVPEIFWHGWPIRSTHDQSYRCDRLLVKVTLNCATSVSLSSDSAA